MPRIVVPDDAPPVLAASPSWRAFELRHPDIGYYGSLPPDAASLIARLEGAAVAVNIRSSTRFTAEVFAACPTLRLLSIWGTGTDNVDLGAASRHGVTVTNTPEVSADSIAEHALALLLAVARRIPALDAEVRRGAWPRGGMVQLAGKTAGVIGLGAIGRRFARLASALGLRVVTWTFHPKPELGFPHLPLEELLTQANVLSLHLRLSAETTGFLDAPRLALLPPGAILINTARGALIDEAALLAALASGRLAGAGLDVFATEPLPAGHPLVTLPNVVLTPHCAGITPEALEAGLSLALENIDAFLAGSPRNVVTPSAKL